MRKPGLIIACAALLLAGCAHIGPRPQDPQPDNATASSNRQAAVQGTSIGLFPFTNVNHFHVEVFFVNGTLSLNGTRVNTEKTPKGDAQVSGLPGM